MSSDNKTTNVQTSLTAPNDRTSNTFSIHEKVDLTHEQTKDAVAELVDKGIVRNYPATERTFADPSIPGQKLCLVSFVPSVDAKPDKDGIYGMIKVRGNYETEEEADDRAELLIRRLIHIIRFLLLLLESRFLRLHHLDGQLIQMR